MKSSPAWLVAVALALAAVVIPLILIFGPRGRHAGRHDPKSEESFVARVVLTELGAALHAASVDENCESLPDAARMLNPEHCPTSYVIFSDDGKPEFHAYDGRPMYVSDDLQLWRTYYEGDTTNVLLRIDLAHGLGSLERLHNKTWRRVKQSTGQPEPKPFPKLE